LPEAQCASKLLSVKAYWSPPDRNFGGF